MTIKTMISTHRPRVSLTRFTFLWWRHNRLLTTLPNYCDVITWILISNSLDTDFIHSDINGRSCALQWCHDERDGVSNHQPHDCLLNRLFRRRSKEASKLRVTGLFRGIHRWPVNSPHKGPVARKMFPFDDVIMKNYAYSTGHSTHQWHISLKHW